MPSLIDPSSVSVSGRRVPALSPFRRLYHRLHCLLRSPFPAPSPPPLCLSPPLRPLPPPPRARKNRPARYRQRGQPRPRKVTGARCESREEPAARSHTLLSPTPCLSFLFLSLSLSSSVSLAGARIGLVLSRRYAARHPRKSTAGGRSRTVAPEPQQPATHDPTDSTPHEPPPPPLPRAFSLLGRAPPLFHHHSPPFILPPSHSFLSFALALPPSPSFSLSRSFRGVALPRPATFASILPLSRFQPHPFSFSHPPHILHRKPLWSSLSLANRPPMKVSLHLSPFPFAFVLSPCASPISFARFLILFIVIPVRLQLYIGRG